MREMTEANRKLNPAAAVDWLVLTAGVLSLAFAVIATLQGSPDTRTAENAATEIAAFNGDV